MTSEQQAKNRRRLIQQNKKLHKEIYLLSEQFNVLMEKDQQVVNKRKGQITPQLQSKITEIQAQQKYIKMLKTKLSYLKSTNAQSNSIYLKNQQNDLVYLKKQLANLQEQRQLLNKQKADKLKSLMRNQPLSQHKYDIFEKFNKVKKQNRQSANNITQLQREIRKYHEIVQLSKLPHDSIENPQIMLIGIEHEMKQTHKKINEMTQKWRLNFQTLDKQYLQFREQYHKKEQLYDELDKQYKIMDLKICGIRQQSDVLNDRARVSSVPQLKQEDKFSSFLAKQSPKKKIKTPSLQSKVPVFYQPKKKKTTEEIKDIELSKNQISSSLSLQNKQLLKNKTIPLMQKNLLKKPALKQDQNVVKVINNGQGKEKKNRQTKEEKSKPKKMVQEVNKGISANLQSKKGQHPKRSLENKNDSTKSEKPNNKIRDTTSQLSFKSSQKIKVREVQNKKKLLKNIGVGASMPL